MKKRQKRTWAHVKFGFFVARDFLLVLIVLNLLVLGMGWIGNAIWQNFETYVVNVFRFVVPEFADDRIFPSSPFWKNQYSSVCIVLGEF